MLFFREDEPPYVEAQGSYCILSQVYKLLLMVTKTLEKIMGKNQKGFKLTHVCTIVIGSDCCLTEYVKRATAAATSVGKGPG